MALMDPIDLPLGLFLADHKFLSSIWAKNIEYLLVCGR